ncbi:hypothetical protein GUY40_20815 [Pseudomonas sp. R5(2019)]|nr:hypothetical protein [Pseudomonas sp. R5(2019)]NBA97360.1 hypothetical protein [Pseudomonas sp. R5(2019)]
MRQLLTLDQRAHLAAQCFEPVITAVETVHADKVAGGRCGVFQHQAVDLQGVLGHGQADAGGVVAGRAQVQRVKSGIQNRAALGDGALVAVEYVCWPGVVGKGQPGRAVPGGVDVDEGGGDVVVLLDARLAQGSRHCQGHLERTELAQRTFRGDLIGLPLLLVEQHVEEAVAEGARLVGAHGDRLKVAGIGMPLLLGRPRRRRIRGAQRQDRQAGALAGVAAAGWVGAAFAHGDADVLTGVHV